MEHPTILVVDDEDEILGLMKDFLESDGFNVLTAKNGLVALSLLERTHVDGVLLDIMLPGESGFEICRKIRKTHDIPLIFLSARQEDHDRIRGLGLGADDYIVKSTTPSVIVAKVKATLRLFQRSQEKQTASSAAPLCFEELTIHPDAYEVWMGNERISLTTKEFQLLKLLADHPKRVFTTEELFRRVWGVEGDDPQTIRVHIARIRGKIEKDPMKTKWIHTVWGVGYKFEWKRT